MSGGGGGLRQRLVGRPFVSPAFDYLAIGGGLSLLWFALLGAEPWVGQVDRSALVIAMFLANCAHFAGSTVRLYTMPGATRALPGLTMVFPTVALAVVTFCLLDAERIGWHLQSLYLTWSPYHYAAQTYGLAVMYSYRSGCVLEAREKRLLRWVCLLPFFYSFVGGPGSGLDWLLPPGIAEQRWCGALRLSAVQLLPPLIFVAPLAHFAWTWRSRSGPMPLISLVIVAANGVWFVVAGYYEAFLWATVAHAIQYLAIVMIFHARERTAEPGNRHGAGWHAAWFYAVSLALAYPLFFALPLVYVWVGFGRVESMILVFAAINVHHFIVDAYIWHLGRGGSNRRIVDAGAALPA